MKPITFTLIMTLTLAGSLIGQEDANAQYFEDGGRSERKNVMKVGLLSFGHGDLFVAFEKKLNLKFGLEGGLGVIMPWHVPELTEATSEIDEGLNDASGYSLRIHPTWNYHQNSIKTLYWGLQYRRRAYYLNVLEPFTGERLYAFHNDFLFTGGIKYAFGSRFAVDLGYGIGVNLIHSNREYYRKMDASKVKFSLPITLKLGYIIK